jgi:hypothetical protein
MTLTAAADPRTRDSNGKLQKSRLAKIWLRSNETPSDHNLGASMPSWARPDWSGSDRTRSSGAADEITHCPMP